MGLWPYGVLYVIILIYYCTCMYIIIIDSPEDLGVQFVEMFIKKQSNIELILSTLEVCTLFYVLCYTSSEMQFIIMGVYIVITTLYSSVFYVCIYIYIYIYIYDIEYYVHNIILYRSLIFKYEDQQLNS